MHHHRYSHHDDPTRDLIYRLAHRCGPRHHGRRGFGRFAGGFADDADGDGRGFRSGRKLSSDDLQLVILALIHDKPRHGYDIIKVLEERSNGFYVPSPGVVYPSLTYLEEVGYAAVEVDGSRKLHRLTEAGGLYLARHRDAVDAILSQIEKVGLKMERFRQAVEDEDRGRSGHRGRRRHGRDGIKEGTAVGRSRAALKTALCDLRHATAEEEACIVEILDRATSEIRAMQAKWRS
jgi:DNA-binding PadR family transcriptional regulator